MDSERLGGGSQGLTGGVADSLDEAEAAWERGRLS